MDIKSILGTESSFSTMTVRRELYFHFYLKQRWKRERRAGYVSR